MKLNGTLTPDDSNYFDLQKKIASLKINQRNIGLEYMDTCKTLLKIVIPSVAMVVSVVLLKKEVSVNLYSKTSCIIYIAIMSIFGALVYLLIAWKQGLIEHVFGKRTLNKFKSKIIKTKKGN